jgi:hypothetical protein
MRKEVKDGARDPHLVRDQYEDYWSGVLDHAAGSSRPNRAVGTRRQPVSGGVCRAPAQDPLDARPPHSRDPRRPPLPPRLSPRCIDTISRVAITDLVAGYCSADTKRIIELGSGWEPTCSTYGSAARRRSATYVAMEYTEAGREATQLLGGTEPNLALTTRPFDYHRPDLSEFRIGEKTLVFTSFSIEQITHLSGSLFEELLAIPGLDRVIHVEPVSWQLLAESAVGPLIGWLSTRCRCGCPEIVSVGAAVRTAQIRICSKLRGWARRQSSDRAHREELHGPILSTATAIVWRLEPHWPE